MAGPTMSKEKYDSLSKRERWAYWLIVAAACLVIGYFLLR